MLKLPFVVAVVVPSVIVLLGNSQDTRWDLNAAFAPPVLIGAAALIVVGLALFMWTNWLFDRVGKGTLAPWNPPSRLVVRGPYRYTRNPMLLGVHLVLAGLALGFGSWMLSAWALYFGTLITVYFLRKEEPTLRERYGADYERYTRNVRRWIPRMSPWTP